MTSCITTTDKQKGDVSQPENTHQRLSVEKDRRDGSVIVPQQHRSTSGGPDGCTANTAARLFSEPRGRFPLIATSDFHRTK